MNLKIIALTGLLTGVFAASSSASGLIDFEDFAPQDTVVPVTPTAPFTEFGFTFTPVSNQSAVFGALYAPTTFGSDSTAWFGFLSGNTITMTAATDIFDLTSLDVGPDSHGGGNDTVTITGFLNGGGTEMMTFSGLTTETLETLDWTNLTAATFVGSSETGMDNISTDADVDTEAGAAAPEPGTWLLLAAGLGAVAVRRRSAA